VRGRLLPVAGFKGTPEAIERQWCGHSTASPEKIDGGFGAPLTAPWKKSCWLGPNSGGRHRPERPRGGVGLTHYYQRSGLSLPINWFSSTEPGLYPTAERDRIDELRRRRRLPSNEHGFPLSVC
jgi:hypothetical protein